MKNTTFEKWKFKLLQLELVCGVCVCVRVNNLLRIVYSSVEYDMNKDSFEI